MENKTGTAAERVADVLRRGITEGDLRPGQQLSEEKLVASLAVSRNTLREAFRLLAHDGLLVHRLNRGVFVAEFDEDDVIELYELRRILECGIVRSLVGLDSDRLAPLRAEVEDAERAASRGDWDEVGTGNMRFHQQLVGLAGNRRADDLTRRLLAELRLIFQVMASPQALHSRYVDRNRALLETLAAGNVRDAADELERYLHDSEEQLLNAYRSAHHSVVDRGHDDLSPVGGASR
jgi:DNA-binding GntR family transcriptional regulator